MVSNFRGCLSGLVVRALDSGYRVWGSNPLVACRKVRGALSHHSLVPSLRTAWDIFSVFEPCFFITSINTFDRLFQGAMAALNGSNSIPWGCLALIWNLILSWQLPTRAQVVYPVRWRILQMFSKMQLTAVPGCHDSSEWLKWHALTLSRFNMTSHSQLTIANSGSSFLPPLDDGSSKWLQRCSWRLFQGAMVALNGWNDMPSCCLALI